MKKIIFITIYFYSINIFGQIFSKGYDVFKSNYDNVSECKMNSCNQIKVEDTSSKVAYSFNFSFTFAKTKDTTGSWRYAFSFFNHYKLSKHLNFNVGISYDFLQDKLNANSNYYYNYDPDGIIKRKYSFLSIPKSLSIKLNSKYLIFLFELGWQTSILLQNEYTYEYNSDHFKSYFSTRTSLCAFYYLGSGLVFKTKKNWGILFSFDYFNTIFPLSWIKYSGNGNLVDYKIYLNYFKINIGTVFRL